MVVRDFAQFVEDQQTLSSGPDFDWTWTKDQRLNELDSLYVRISQYLNEFIDQRTTGITYTSVEVSEEGYEPYAAKKIWLQIGRQL